MSSTKLKLTPKKTKVRAMRVRYADIADGSERSYGLASSMMAGMMMHEEESSTVSLRGSDRLKKSRRCLSESPGVRHGAVPMLMRAMH